MTLSRLVEHQEFPRVAFGSLPLRCLRSHRWWRYGRGVRMLCLKMATASRSAKFFAPLSANAC